MTPNLSATHLLRRFLLFALTLLFLLTTLRAGYTLWLYTALSMGDEVQSLFVQGLRVDLALIGLLLLPLVVIAPLLGAFDALRGVARLLVSALLTASVVAVLLIEYITPAFLSRDGVRPDASLLGGFDDVLAFVLASLRAAPLPSLLGALLIALVTIAFMTRLETSRLLSRPLGLASALVLSLVGGLVCVIAVWSGVPGLSDALTMPAARISQEPLLNELVLNSTWKLLYPPVIEPMLALLSSVPSR